MSKKKIKNKKELIIYTNEQCPYCKKIKEFLQEKEIKFVNKITTENEKEWNNIVGLTGIPQVPTIFHNNHYFLPQRDFFNEEHLLQIIEKFEPCSFSIEEQINEKLKTLNFNISQAFNGLEMRLKNIENFTKPNPIKETKNVDKSTS